MPFVNIVQYYWRWMPQSGNCICKCVSCSVHVFSSRHANAATILILPPPKLQVCLQKQKLALRRQNQRCKGKEAVVSAAANWLQNWEAAKTRGSFELKRISSICRFLTEDATKTLVTSYILSRLDYCNCLLMGPPNSVIQPLQKIQNFAARLVLLAPRHHQATPFLEKLHWLPISERIKYKVACMCFSAINGSGPAYLSELLHVYTPSRTLRSSSDTRMLEIQQYKRKTHGFRTFSCFGPHIWNSLPQDLRHCSTLSSFKAKLKTENLPLLTVFPS